MRNAWFAGNFSGSVLTPPLVKIAPPALGDGVLRPPARVAQMVSEKGEGHMTVAVLIVVIAAVVLLAAIAYSVARRRRSVHLQERFGTEYEHVVTDTGSRRDAEHELVSREKRRSALDIRPLDRDARDDYASAWESVQAGFVDSPNDAIGRADLLVHQVMRDRGYPVDDFEQRGAEHHGSTPPGCGRRLPRRPRHLAAQRRRRGEHRGPAPGDGALPIALRRPARRRDHQDHALKEARPWARDFPPRT